MESLTSPTPPSAPRLARRLPFLLPAAAALLAGMWLGLVRLGWELPLWTRLVTGVHGPLMVSGFLGTLIGLERAVALGRRWAFAAPLLSALGAVATALAPRAWLGAALLVAGAILLAAVGVVLAKRHREFHLWVMSAGAACLVVADLLWAAGWPPYRMVLWWTAFPLLTIAGERLELNRLLRPSRTGRALFRGGLAAFGAGLALSLVHGDAGLRLAGVGLAGLGVWFGLHDLARRTIRTPGLPRFVAACLLAGYAWLAFAGGFAVVRGEMLPGPDYDAFLHALFLGFTFSMILGHAPIVFPAVIGLPVPFRTAAYGPLLLLHAGLLVRVAGDLTWGISTRAWGGILNVAAILAFIAVTAASVLGSRRRSEVESPAAAIR